MARNVANPMGRAGWTAHMRGGLVVLVLALTAWLATPAFADKLDDIYAKLFENKFSQTEQAVAAIAATAPPHGAEMLEALGDNRLYVDPANHRVIYKTTGGQAFDARTGAKAEGVEGLKRVRVNNGVRNAIDRAMGSLGVGNPDPQRRLAAARDLYAHPNPKALAVVDAQLAKETDPAAKMVLEQARAAILAASPSVGAEDAKRAIATLADRGGEAAKNYISSLAAKTSDPAVRKAADAALAGVNRAIALWGIAQNGWYGLSAASVLLLAAIGLAITFGVMGVINMAHGEMVMLGAYATYVVQLILPPSMADWSVVLALPIAFLASAAAGVAIERTVVRYLYTRPLDTLLATWGVSLILQQAVRTLFGASNRQVYAPPFLSGAFHLGGIEITYNRLWIIALSGAVFALLLFVLRATSFGLQMRAVTQNRRMASAMGISTVKVDMLAFALGSGVAGIAGVALSQIDNVSPNLGQGYIIDSFMVVVFGGVGNLWGAALGALTLGLANKFLEPVVGAVQGQIILLVFIILFIQKRPRGLFAQKGRAVES
jgi:urea transport system permease protein